MPLMITLPWTALLSVHRRSMSMTISMLVVAMMIMRRKRMRMFLEMI